MLTRSTSITSEDQTLIFKHLPEDLTANDCAEFLSNLGATSSSYFGNKGPLRNCALAEFSSTEHAWKVIKSVHQRVILRRRISVEFFSQSDSLFKCATIEPEAECEISHLSPLPHLPEQEPIVPRWDISLSVPVNMYYKYPSPSPSILTNIIRCMASCPAFYTQVLHLMNRLHLPPPFGDPELFPGTLTVISEPWLPSALKSQPVQNPVSPVVNTTEAMDLSSSAESELQSDENECVNMESKHFVPKARSRKRRLFGHSRGSTQKLSIAPVAVSADAGKHSDVSELFEIGPAVQPKMQLHVPSELPSTTSPHMIAQSRDSEGGFGIMKPSNRSLVELPKGPTDRNLRSTFKLRKSPSPDDSDDALTPSCPVAEENASEHSQLSLSLNDLRLRRLTQEERQNYAVFAKNYAPGDPTSRLYIKNLSPLVTEEDLYRVYGAFQSGLVENVHFRPPVPTTSTDRLAIRLLTGGRMKGQAFVSLNSEQTAIQALEATNGLLLHDRPMVVQFARGAKGKVDENTLIT